MSNDLNNFMFSGNLSRDAEVKKKADGTDYLAFTVANNLSQKDKQHTEFISCLIFNENWFNSIKDHLKTGTGLTAIGKVKASAYLTKEGVARGNLSVLVSDLKITKFVESKPRDDGYTDMGNSEMPF